MTQPSLLDWTPPIKNLPPYAEDGWRDIAAEFVVFHRNNPHVYELFKRFANEVRASGHTKFSARDIFPRIRWYTMVETRGDPDGMKINNNWSPFYARMIAQEDSRFRDFFQFRTSKADKKRVLSEVK